jgi:hypothetical protein
MYFFMVEKFLHTEMSANLWGAMATINHKKNVVSRKKIKSTGNLMKNLLFIAMFFVLVFAYF